MTTESKTSASGADLIAAERARQIEVEGYDADADQGKAAALAAAGACYAWAQADALSYIGTPSEGAEAATHYLEKGVPGMWPWARHFWKPTGDPVRDLVKAGALIAAAIDAIAAEEPPAREYGAGLPQNQTLTCLTCRKNVVWGNYALRWTHVVQTQGGETHAVMLKERNVGLSD